MHLLTNDDPVQAQRVAALIEALAACFVPITMTLKLEWVLRGAYRLPHKAVIRAFEGLLAIRQLHLEQEEQVLRALEGHHKGLFFADALLLARSEGCAGLISFDHSLESLAAQLQLSPGVQKPPQLA